MNPCVRIRLRHPKELSLNFLEEILFYVGQDEEQLVSHRRQGTGLICTVAAARAGLPINSPILHVADKRLLEIGQQALKFFFG
jgi:hypothetical protein